MQSGTSFISYIIKAGPITDCKAAYNYPVKK